MAQLTMQRHNPIAYEGRISISPSTETKFTQPKALKNESSDPFQKSMPKKSEPETETKKISERNLKRRPESNDTKLEQFSNKKLRPLQSDKRSETPSVQQETALPLKKSEASDNTLTLVSKSEEMTELTADLFQEESQIELGLNLKVSEPVRTNSQLKEQLQIDLEEIASLETKTSPLTQDMQPTEESYLLAQADLAPVTMPVMNEASVEETAPQVSNSFVSASLIDNQKQSSTHQDEKDSDKTHAESMTLFTLNSHTDDSDLIEISELKVDDSEPVQETPKRKKSKETEDTRPKQLSFAFIEQAPQEIKIENEPHQAQEKLVLEVETTQVKTQQENAQQIDAIDHDITEEVKHSKGIASSAESAAITSLNDKAPQAFGMTTNSASALNAPITNATSATPTLMPATNQTGPEQVAVKLITALNNGDDQIHIRLTPEDLGEITIKLNISDNRVNALIQSDNAETLKLLQKDSQTLENTLKDSGFTLESHNMEFSFSGGSSRQDQQILHNEFTQNNQSLLNDDMLTSLTELAANDAQGRDYILTPTKVDIHI